MTMQKPPINALTGGISFKNSHTQIGAQRVSDNIKIPTVVARVVFDPIVIHINPKANCGTPSIKPIKILWLEKLRDSESTKP